MSIRNLQGQHRSSSQGLGNKEVHGAEDKVSRARHYPAELFWLLLLPALAEHGFTTDPGFTTVPNLALFLCLLPALRQLCLPPSSVKASLPSQGASPMESGKLMNSRCPGIRQVQGVPARHPLLSRGPADCSRRH